MTYSLPEDVDQRPVAIDGAGTLGRRIAAVHAGGGSDVPIFDTSGEQREAAKDYVDEHIAETQKTLGLRPDHPGRVGAAEDLETAVAGAWMVIEAVPENVDLKIDGFGDLDRLIEVPAQKVTACTFGGDDLGTLYITTSREDLAAGEDPKAGSLFAAEPGVRGRPVREFAG